MSARRLAVFATAAAAALIGVLGLPAGPAQAHPLGNFSVNQYGGLVLHADRIDVTALVDVAEIPTLQEKPLVDTDGDGVLSGTERAGYAAAECGRLADGIAVSAGGDRLAWTVTAPSYDVTPGAAGLATSRLGCRLSAPAQLAEPTTVRVDNGYRAGRVGWRELTATGDGVRLVDSPLPTQSISGQLRSYPRELLTSAPDVRSATIRVGGAAGSGAAPAETPGATTRVTVAGPGWLVAAQRRVESVVGGRLNPVVIALAFLLALLLGAGHAALPGHGKTVMAAYFAGRRGRIGDALAVGGTVTLAHTGGVLLVGLLLSTSTVLAGERVLAWLGGASGLLVTTVGLAMLVSARRSHSADAVFGHAHGPHGHQHGSHAPAHADPAAVDDAHGYEHSHPYDAQGQGRAGGAHGHGHSYADDVLGHVRAHDAHGHDHSDAGDGHGHGHAGGARGHGHSHADHEHAPADGHDDAGGHEHAGHSHGTGRGHQQSGHHHRPGGRLGLAGIGLAGGLVPSPSALVVLLGAIGIGRAGLGVLLVLAYGLGMAGTLTAVGLLLVVAQRRLAGLRARGGRAARVTGLLSGLAARVSAGAPTATAALVVLVGLGMGVRAVV